MRLAILGVWIVVLFAVLVPLLRRTATPGPRRIASDELVKDPVCGTYVVPSKALTASRDNQTAWFCSPECQQAWQRR